MRRRDLLSAATAAAAGGLGGCFDFGSMYSSGMLAAADLATCPEAEREGTPVPGGDTDHPVQVVVRNDSDAERRVTVTIDRVGRTYFDDTIAVPSGSSRPLFDGASGPQTTGEYRLSVNIEDGSRLSVDWRVCKYTDDLVVIVSSGGGLGFERPD
jgi:hypothetical protein